MSSGRLFRTSLEPEDIESIITAYFISRLCRIILCKSEFDDKDLKAWEIGSVALQGKEISYYDFHLTKMVLASAQTKLAGNPDNIRTLLIYEISHVNIGKVKGEKCHRCGLPVDKRRRGRMLQRIQKGYSLKDLKHLVDCDDLIGTHLTEEEVCRFADHEISLSAQRKRVRQYFQQV